MGGEVRIEGDKAEPVASKEEKTRSGDRSLEISP